MSHNTDSGVFSKLGQKGRGGGDGVVGEGGKGAEQVYLQSQLDRKKQMGGGGGQK